MANFFKTCLTTFVAITVSIGLSELIIRQFVHPVDYLLPRLVADPYLGHRIAPDTGGHDDWGYRNYTVPSSSKIVAIGDSQTYGISATFQNAWPTHLSRLIDKRVYNLALGGYGPLHYLHLMRTRALELDPEIVIVGLYFGNDVIDTYRLAYSNKHWEKYKNPLLIHEKSEPTEINPNKKADRLLNDTRSWLSQHSVLYRMITSSILFDFVRDYEFKEIGSDIIDLKFGDVQQLFEPGAGDDALNIDSQNIREGIRISKEALSEIKTISDDHQIKLLVALIPTRVFVYADLLKDNLKDSLVDSYDKRFEDETKIRSEFISFFHEERINFVDTLGALRVAALQNESIYPINDRHPNGAGYFIIAKEISDAL